MFNGLQFPLPTIPVPPGYNISMYGLPPTRHRTVLLYSMFYFAFAGVAARGLEVYFSNDLEWRWVAIPLVLSFGLLAAICHWPIRWLWRFPHFYLAVQTALVLTLLLLPPRIDVWGILYFLLSAQAMTMFRQRIGFAWITIFAGAALSSITYTLGWREGILSGAVYASGYYFFGAFATATAQSEAARHRSQDLLVELESANEQLREHAAQAEELAAVQERNRLARELHDSVTQTIFSMTLTAESSRILLKRDPNQVEPQLDRLNELAQGALEEMRTLILELRSAAVAQDGLIPALHKHVDSLKQRDGLVVELNIHGDSSIGSEQEEGLFRIVQESLNNVSKHARVDKALVTLQQTNGRVVLAVEDQGVGFDVSEVPLGEEHMGLTSIRERTEMLKGNLKVESSPGKGTRITVDIPAEVT